MSQEPQGVRISRYLVYTNSILTASSVAARLDGRLAKGKTIPVRGSVAVKGTRIKYTMMRSDLDALETGR
jgi:hypothetical protein